VDEISRTLAPRISLLCLHFRLTIPLFPVGIDCRARTHARAHKQRDGESRGDFISASRRGTDSLKRETNELFRRQIRAFIRHEFSLFNGVLDFVAPPTRVLAVAA